MLGAEATSLGVGWKERSHWLMGITVEVMFYCYFSNNWKKWVYMLVGEEKPVEQIIEEGKKELVEPRRAQ